MRDEAGREDAGTRGRDGKRMPNIRSFKDLRVWHGAMDLAMRVFELTKRFPAEERYSLTDQFRRASRSVPGNIAEAWRKRRYPAAFIAKLSDSEGEAAETQTWIEFSRRCAYLDATTAAELDRGYEEILSQLVHMIAHADDWVIPPPRPVPETGRAETDRPR
jgi:four helix bundle protein